MKLRKKDAQRLYMALAQLKTYKKIVRKNGNDETEDQPFDFSGDLRVQIARNKVMLKSHVEAFELGTNELIKETQGDNTELSGKVQIALAEAINKFADEEVEVDLTRIKQSSLKLDDNKAIHSDILEGLDPILDYEATA